jgi:hypothetical protein
MTVGYCVLLISFADDNQRSNLDVNNFEARTAMNDVILDDHCHAFWWDPQQACLGFLLKKTLSAF